MEKEDYRFFVGYSRRMLVKGMFLVALMSFLYTLSIGWFGTLFFLAYILAHEMGHMFVLKRVGIRIKKFYLHPFGAVIENEDKAKSLKAELIIGLMGPAMGLFFVLLFLAGYGQSRNSVFLVLALFIAFNDFLNLMPAEPIDGGLAIKAIAFNFQPLVRYLIIGIGFVLSLVGVLLWFATLTQIVMRHVFWGIADSFFTNQFSVYSLCFSLWLGLFAGLILGWMAWLGKGYYQEERKEKEKEKIKMSGKEIWVHTGLYLLLILVNLTIIGASTWLIATNPAGLLDLPKLWLRVY